MLESRKSTTPVAVRTAAIVGFTPLERAGLALLLAEHQVSVVDVFDELVEYGPAVHTEIALVDLAMITRDGPAGVAMHHVVDAWREAHPHTAIFGVYQHSSGPFLRTDTLPVFDALIDAGGRPETMLAAILGTGTARRPWRKPAIATAPLTRREQQILRLIGNGNTSKAIADTLGISIHTVDNHKQRVFRRLGVQNQAQAVSVALRLGLIEQCEQHQGAAS